MYAGAELKMVCGTRRLRDRWEDRYSHANEVERRAFLLEQQHIAHIPAEGPMARGIVFRDAAKIERA